MTTTIYALIIIFTVNDGMGARQEVRYQDNKEYCKINEATLRRAWAQNPDMKNWSVTCMQLNKTWTPVP